MRVLVATTVGRTATAFLRPQLERLAARHDVALMCADTNELRHVPDSVEVVVAPWSRPMSKTRIPRALRRLRNTIVSRRPDVVYLHTAIAAGLVRLGVIGLRNRPRVVYCAHGFDGAEAQPWIRRTSSRGVERFLALVTDVVIVMNDEDERWARTLSSTKVVRVPSVGIDLARWARSSPPREPTPPFDVVLIAELSARKRVDLAIEAVPHLSDDYRLRVVGDGPLRPELEARAVDLGVAGRVEFVGAVDDTRPEIELAHVVVSCSRQEGLSRSILEALALGTPVVGTDARGVTDVLRDGAGIVVASTDPKRLAAAVVAACENRDQRDAMIAAGRRVASEHDADLVTPMFIRAVEGTTP
jgi:glycosyltransferase involved in cell wall biosynthesis